MASVHPSLSDNHICFDRVIPPEHHPAHASSERATIHHLVSSGHLDALRNIDPSGVIPAPHAAIVVAKKWEPGHTLTCRFLDGTSTQQEKVIAKAKIWHDYANIDLSFVLDGAAEVRVSFSADPGSWSAVGTDALVESYFPKHQPTMNFGWLKDDTADNEYERVVVHEFGHALGLIHEHQSPAEHLHWDTAAVYRSFSGPPNFWPKDQIDFNILEKYSANGLKFTAFDRMSIMLYQFPANLFTDHKGTPLNFALSPKDKKFIAQM